MKILLVFLLCFLALSFVCIAWFCTVCFIDRVRNQRRMESSPHLHEWERFKLGFVEIEPERFVDLDALYCPCGVIRAVEPIRPAIVKAQAAGAANA